VEKQIVSFKQELLSSDKSLVISKWILEPCPHIFRDDYLSYLQWKITLGEIINVDPKDIVIIGSAGLGFSLNPYKNFKVFDEKSDIDIAIISHYHFDIAWFALRHLGTKRLRLTPKESASLNDHVNRLIYWGTIATDKLLHFLPFCIEWQQAIDKMQKSYAVFKREINFRIYNDYDSLRSYTLNNMQKLQDQLLEEIT
jgi:hypothetical protein